MHEQELDNLRNENMTNTEKNENILINDLSFKVENTQELVCNKCKELAHLQSKYDEMYEEEFIDAEEFVDKQIPPVMEEALNCKYCDIVCSQTDILKKHIKRNTKIVVTYAL